MKLSSFICILLMLPNAVQAAIECKAMKLAGSVYQEKILEVGTDRDGVFTAHGKIEDCYYSIQGLTDRNRFSLSFSLDDPKPNGSGIFSDGSFDGDGYMRMSFVKERMVYKLVCSNKGPIAFQ